jgi:hypothetical protein
VVEVKATFLPDQIASLQSKIENPAAIEVTQGVKS